MEMHKHLVFGAVALLALGACGSGASGDAAKTSGPPSVTTLAKKGCPGGQFQMEKEQEMYAKETANCPNGVRIVTFNDDKGQKAYLDVAKTFGGTYKEGHLFVVAGDDASATAAVADKVGAK